MPRCAEGHRLDHRRAEAQWRPAAGGRCTGRPMATMALSEVYTMTGDERLVSPLKKAVTFIIEAQNPGLAWRYEPRKDNDTSVVGWQVMALKSAEIAGVEIPGELLSRGGQLAGHRSQRRPRGSTAISRGGDAGHDRRRIVHGAVHPVSAEQPADRGLGGLPAEHSPSFVRKNTDKNNFYYWYYGTLALHQLGGPAWEEWNRSVSKARLRRNGPTGRSPEAGMNGLPGAARRTCLHDGYCRPDARSLLPLPAVLRPDTRRAGIRVRVAPAPLSAARSRRFRLSRG